MAFSTQGCGLGDQPIRSSYLSNRHMSLSLPLPVHWHMFLHNTKSEHPSMLGGWGTGPWVRGMGTLHHRLFTGPLFFHRKKDWVDRYIDFGEYVYISSCRFIRLVHSNVPTFSSHISSLPNKLSWEPGIVFTMGIGLKNYPSR